MSSNSLKIKDITGYLESIAPLEYQEGYDNAGLLTGHSDMDVKGVLVSLDCTEEIVDEAISKGCNLIVAHHPVIFNGLKKLNGNNYVERTVIRAVKNDIAIYAIHTNLDNVHVGVNKKIAEKIGLNYLRILSPKNNLLKKIATFVPQDHLEKVRNAMFEAGAGTIGNYDQCSFSAGGTGSFRGNNESAPFVGEKKGNNTMKKNKD